MSRRLIARLMPSQLAAREVPGQARDGGMTC
jgi:hypothetical protein